MKWFNNGLYRKLNWEVDTGAKIASDQIQGRSQVKELNLIPHLRVRQRLQSCVTWSIYGNREVLTDLKNKTEAQKNKKIKKMEQQQTFIWSLILEM